MPATRKRNLSSTLDDLAPVFNAPFDDNDASAAALWDSYHRHQGTDVYQKLMVHYVPLVAAVARHAKRRKPGFYRGVVDDMVSDGVFGLIDAIVKQREGMPHFRLWAVRKIRSHMIRGEMNRRWGKEFRFVRDSVIAEIRERAVQDLGRVPTPEEMTARLRGRIPNPAFYASHDPKEFSRSQATTKRERRAIGRESGTDRLEPHRTMIDREAMKIAIKGFKGDDRTILKCVLAGYSTSEIRAKIKVKLSESGIRDRINGVLWEARTRGDLAKYLSVEPIEKPSMGHGNHLPSIRLQPPARMVG